ALGGAELMIEAERGALILHVERTRAQQVHQARQHGTKGAALQPGTLRKVEDRGLRCIRRKRAEWRGRSIVVGRQANVLGVRAAERWACIAGFERHSNAIVISRENDAYKLPAFSNYARCRSNSAPQPRLTARRHREHRGTAQLIYAAFFTATLGWRRKRP